MVAPRTHHPMLGTVVRCGYGHLGRRRETQPCGETFYSASDPEVITEQVDAAGWGKRRVRVPLAAQTAEHLPARATQYLCPGHVRIIRETKGEAEVRSPISAPVVQP